MRYILLLIMTFFLVSCSVNKNQNVKNSTYRGKESQETITFIDEIFFIRSSSDFIDTLSYGNWKQENNMIVLYSDKSMHRNFFDINVEESFTRSKDSVYFSIENRLSGLTDAADRYIPFLYFNVNRYFLNNRFDMSDPFAKNISFLDTTPLSEFNITIIPNLLIYDEKISGKAFETFKYRIKSSKNNTFKIKILDFKKEYFALKIFNGEYIKIVDNDTLLWDNQLFIRE